MIFKISYQENWYLPINPSPVAESKTPISLVFKDKAFQQSVLEAVGKVKQPRRILSSDERTITEQESHY